MQGDDPPYLPVGTAVSAKYKGAFCEAKVSKVVRCVKCKISYKMGLGIATVTDEQIKGPLRVGHTVQARHTDKKEFIEATITKIQDCSQYTVVFDDGDITTLRRTALCLKSGRHFNESETLDQLPLTHPEHFGNPVVGGRRGRRSRQLKEDSSEGEPEEEAEPDLDLYSSDIGKVVCIEGNDKKKSRENWFPGLVVVPSAQPTVRINVREEYLIRSFKDGRYYTVPKKEISEFSRDMTARVESTALTEAMEKAIKYLDRDELPVHWERSTLFNLQAAESDSDDNMSNSSDDEPREEKDHFVAQLYKFLDDRGTPLNKTPTIANREIDLYRLFRVVEKFGGFNRVTNQTKWRSVSIRLGYPNNHATYNSVKQAYKKYIFNFEEFYRKLGCTMINHPRSAKKHRGRSLIRDRDRATPVNSPRPDEVVTPAPEEPKELKEPPPPTATVAAPPVPVNVKPAKVSKEEKKVEMLASDSSNSSDAIIDVQSDSSEKKIKEEKKKEVAVKVKERKVKAATGEKVKALVEQFEEQQTSTTKKEPKPPPAPPVADDDKEKIQQTRSKSQLMPKKELTSSPDRKDAPSRLAKPIKKPEEEKKRGRKRKDTETSSETKAAVDLSPETVLTQSINIGDKLKVYYGPTHESKVTYEAKVLEIDKDTSGTIYLVHYTGWNTRYDEWIKPVRIAENLSLTTKAKRLKQGQGPSNKNQSTPPKAAGKRGRGTSISSRSEPPGIPRSTTPSSVTSSSSRTKSPATPASKSTSRVTRQGGDTHRRTRRTSAHTDLSLASDSDSSHQSSSDTEELATRTRSSASKVEEKKKLLKNIKKEEDSDKEDEVIIERPKRKKKKVLEIKPSTESDEDSTPPPKGRDFDLNQIRSELKGFEKAVKIPVTPETPEPPVVVEEKLIDIKVEKKEKEEDKTDDIYEFKEPEPFEFEARAPTKLSEDKSSKKRVAKVYEEAEKSPKKKGKSPPKVDEEKKQRGFISKQRKEDDNLEEETISPIKTEDPFDKLVESPSFNIGGKKSPEPSKSQAQARVVKALNMDETLSLFRDIPETVGDDSRDRLELSDTDDTQTEPLFTHKEQIFLDPSITKPELDTIFRFAEADPKNTKEEEEEDSISAAIQRAISNTMTDEDTSDDIFMPQSTSTYQPIKIDPTPSPTPPDINKEPDLDTPKLISPALQETDSSLLISLQTELLIKQEDVQEVPIKTGTKIADSILQKFNLIKKSEEDPKIITAPPPPPPLREKTPEPPLPDPPAVVVPPPEPAPEIFPESNKKRAKKIVSREFLSDTDDSSDSEERLVIARSDEDDDSQTTNPSKDTDSNVSVAPPEVMVVVEDPIPPEPRNFKLDLIKAEPEEQQPEPVPEPDTKQPVKEEEDSNISLLLCKETIPGSPAPVTEPVPVVVEPRTKPKSAKSLLLEMPFASAPGSSNSKPIMATTVEPTVEADEKQAPLAVPLELPLEAASQPNNNTVIENTPPTTPESTISNLSPRGDQDRISPTVADNESCKSTDSGQQRAQTSKITHYSEEDTLMNVVESCPVVPKKSSPPQVTAPTRPPPDEVPAGPCRKRRRSCKSTTEDVVPPPVKRGRRPNVRNLRAQSDSDSDTHSAPGSTPPTTTTTGLSLIAAISTAPMDGRIRSRSPRPSKYNFIIELDPAMNSTQRIALIQQNFSDLRRTYNHFKTELACIDRRRKKLRRREREALKAAKQEMACT